MRRKRRERRGKPRPLRVGIAAALIYLPEAIGGRHSFWHYFECPVVTNDDRFLLILSTETTLYKLSAKGDSQCIVAE
jgi:hypothetical protein